MKKQILFVVMAACIASATTYDSTSDPLPITGAMMTPVSSGTPTTISGTGTSWSMNVANQGWSEGYAYMTFEVAPTTRVQITRGTLQNTITDGGQGWYWGDLVIFASAVNPAAAIAGKTTGPTGSDPAPGVMAWVSDSQYDAAGYATSTKAAVNAAGYRYYGGSDGFSSYLAAIGGYSSNVENFRDGGLNINGGAYAGWNQSSATSMASGSPARALTDILYPAGGGLNRPLKDQTCAFDGTVCTGNSTMYVTVMVRGGGGGGGAIAVNDLTLSFSSPGYLPITGAMMKPVVSTGSSAAITGTGSSWSLDVAGSGEAEGYAYATFMIPPNMRVQLTSGTVQNTISGDWYFGDVVLFASSVNPSAAIAGKVAGPTTPGTDAEPAPGVMAYLTYQQFKDNGYKLLVRSKETVTGAGYRYMDNNGTCSSYLQAISQYSSNVENFRDGGLDIDGGAYAGWNQSSATSMASGTPARPLTDILYPAWGGLSRPLKDQTYAFDGTVYTGASNTFVTVMVRGGGGCSSGSVSVDHLGLSLSSVDTLTISGPMMTPVLSTGSSAAISGTGAEWSLDVAGTSEAEGYAYTTFVVGPHTKVKISDGTIQSTLTGTSWWYGDVVIFASSVNPSAAIAGKVAGPTDTTSGSTPAAGVMAYLTYAQFKANGYKLLTQSKDTVTGDGYRYMDNNGTCGSYLEAISQYSSNVENFRDGGLDINGGAYVGWNQSLYPSMPNGTAYALTDLLYPAWGNLNRPLKDQTYAFDGAVYTGSSNMFVTVMVRSGGGDGTGGVITVKDLTLTFTTPGHLPALNMTKQGSSMQFSWPGNTHGIVVEQSDSLTNNAVWTPITESPSLQDDNWTVELPVESGMRFYRLRMD